MDHIEAIPTVYRGTRFRSQLEATWAELFDVLSLSWEYEPVQMKGWVPDFRLEGAWLAEVKPLSGGLVDNPEYQKAFRPFETILLGDKPDWCFGVAVQELPSGIVAHPLFYDMEAATLVRASEKLDHLLFAGVAEWNGICANRSKWREAHSVASGLCFKIASQYQ